MKQTLKDILLHSDTRPVGLLLSGIMLIWGLVLLNPYADTFPISPTYRPMYVYFPTWQMAELVWGAAYTVIGATTLLGVFIPSRLTRNLLLPGIVLLLFTAISLGRGVPGSIGPWLHGLFTLALMWKYIRLAKSH